MRILILFVSFFCRSLLMPWRNHQPCIYICNNGTTRICRSGFLSLSELTHHQNTMHPSNHIENLPAWIPSSPPPDDMNFNAGENILGPHEAIQGGARTLCHPILNSMSFILAFLFIFNRVFSRHAMRLSWKLSTSRYSSSSIWKFYQCWKYICSPFRDNIPSPISWI